VSLENLSSSLDDRLECRRRAILNRRAAGRKRTYRGHSLSCAKGE
jgi:hypothetical protein